MKFALSLFAVLALVVGGVVLAQDGGTIPDGFDAQGPVMWCINTAADADTLWFSATQPTGGDVATDYAAPMKLYKAKRFGGYSELTTQPCALRLYSIDQFAYRAYWKNGKSDPGKVYVDTVQTAPLYTANGNVQSITGRYACFKTIYGVIDSVKVWTADDDTVFAVPLYKWPEGVSVE